MFKAVSNALKSDTQKQIIDLSSSNIDVKRIAADKLVRRNKQDRVPLSLIIQLLNETDSEILDRTLDMISSRKHGTSSEWDHSHQHFDPTKLIAPLRALLQHPSYNVARYSYRLLGDFNDFNEKKYAAVVRDAAVIMDRRKGEEKKNPRFFGDRFLIQKQPARSAEVSAATREHSNYIPSSELDIGVKIGEGGFGFVHRAIWQGINEVAVKKLKNQRLDRESLQEFEREAEIHAQLRHPNIVALYGVCLEPMKYAMVMELMKKGSLCNLLHSRSEALPWSRQIALALNIASGLLYLHARNIIHRDLKSLNILVDENYQAKLSDFGLSKVKHSTQSMTKGGMGTPGWMAPELFEPRASCDKKTDVYAMGIILWEIISRQFPYNTFDNDMQIIMHVSRGGRETIPDASPSQYAGLISSCWAQRASDRPIAQEAVEELQEIVSQNPR